MNNQIVTVNLTPGGSTPAVVRVSQGDIGRPIQFKVLDGTSIASFANSATATVVGTKPTGLGFSVTGTISGNTVTINTTLEMTQESGMIPTEIRFATTSPATVIGTANFILAVEPSPHPEGTTDGTTEEARTVLEQCQAAADAAAQSAADAAEAASQAGEAIVVVTTAVAMTDTEKIYLYGGNETGYTAGHWYYYNGTAWADGGEFKGLTTSDYQIISVIKRMIVVSSTEPTNPDVILWINPEDSSNYTTASDVQDMIDTSLGVIENGSY